MKLLSALPITLFLSLPSSVHAQLQRPVITADSLAKPGASPLTGSIDVVTEARMNKGLVTNSLNALSGQAAGVSVATGENRMAQLSAVRVRGTTSLTGGNDPLVIIDGVYSDLSTLSSIYPADIESFSILKNAAETAQYGSRGASGVIQVTTKKGSGTQFHISYDGNIGFESIYRTIDMLDAAAYIATARARAALYRRRLRHRFPRRGVAHRMGDQPPCGVQRRHREVELSGLLGHDGPQHGGTRERIPQLRVKV